MQGCSNIAHDAAFTNMAAAVVLRDALRAAEKLGRAAHSDWAEIAARLVLPTKGSVIVSHDVTGQRVQQRAHQGG